METRADGLRATPAGRHGQAVDLELEADIALIARTVRAAVEALPIAELVRALATPAADER